MRKLIGTILAAVAAGATLTAAHGADIDWIVFNLTNSEIREHFDTLVAHGADREQLLEDMEAE